MDKLSTPVARINFETIVTLSESEANIYWAAAAEDFPENKKHPFNIMKKEFQTRYNTEMVSFLPRNFWA